MKTCGTFSLALLALLTLAPTPFAQPPTADLRLWLQADTIAGLNTGDKLALWEDTSGNDNHAANPDEATQPVYVTEALNGLPVVRFADGGNVANAGQFLDSALTLNANGVSFSAFVLVRSAAGATARDTLLQPLNPGTNNYGRTVLYLENNAALAYKAKSFASETSLESVRGYAPGEWTVYSLVQDAAARTLSLWRDGQPDGVAAMGAFTTAGGQWRIGDNKPRTAGLQGEIAEVLIYQSALPVSDRAAVEEYLFAKYGLAPGGSGYDLLLRDNFNVSANSNDVNFENASGRQSASAGAIAYLENGVPDALTQVNNADSPGMLRLEANATTAWSAVTPDRNFIDGGNFKIEFDLDAGQNDAANASGDWAAIIFGSTVRGPSFVNASDGLGILFRNQGDIQVFDGATDTGGGGTMPFDLLHVRIEVSTADFAGGSPATVRMFVNGTQVRLGAGMEYVKELGFRGNYLTLEGAAWSGDWVHVFDNLVVAAQPCIRPSLMQVKSHAGQTNQTVAVDIPASLNVAGAVTVTVQSLDPAVAVPLGATGDSLALDFPPGVTSRSFNVSALAHGSTVFTLTGPEGACVGGSLTIGVGVSLVANPSFEENYNATWPHYSPINQWTAIPGGGTGVNDASGPFHDNSTIPDQDRVALHQGTGGISQMISGLARGQQHWLQFRYNKRTGGAMALAVRFAGVEIDSILSIPVASTAPYYFRNVPFTPTADSGLLEFRTTATEDATVLLDAVTIVPRGTNQVVVQNPSFEASGDVPSPGVMTNNIAGWLGTGAYGINRIGEDNADSGWNPDQDHVAFIQGVGSLSQVIANLSVGQPYQIKFGCSAKSTDAPLLRVSMGDTVLFEQGVYPAFPGEAYEQHTLNWMATAKSAELKFEQIDDLGGAVLLDDIQVTGIALPAPETKLSAVSTEYFAGQPLGPTNVSVSLPFYLVATQSVEVLVISLDPSVAVPTGATNGTLALLFKAGNTQPLSFDISVLGAGTAAFLITNQVDCPSAVFTVRNRHSLVLNPSFEDNGTPNWPGYFEIAEWKGGSGLNPITEDNAAGRGPFIDNGVIPDGGQVAFIQGVNAISQLIYGLEPDRQYWLQLFVNARNCCGDAPMGSLRFNGIELAPPTTVSPVGGANPYYFVNVPFTPNSPTGLLEVISGATAANGDRTLLVDAVSLVRRASGVVLQNPSFEASGAPPWPGSLLAMAGWSWSGAGAIGVNISGHGPFADNGLAPDQDNAAFLQGEGAAISQAVSGLTPGEAYELSYAYNARNDNSPRLTVSVDNTIYQDGDVVPVGANRPYLVNTILFQAESDTVVLTFAQTAPGDQTVLLDDVKLAAPAPPELRLAIQPGPAKSVRLAWPHSAGADCALLAASALTGPWLDSGLPVGTEGEDYVAYDQVSPGSKFYRLRKP